MARIALLPPPDPGEFVVDLPRASEPHPCRPYCWPVALYRDAAGTWAEWQCQVCGTVFDQPASLEDFGLAETTWPASGPTGAGDPG